MHIVCVDAFRSFRGCCCTFYIEPIFFIDFFYISFEFTSILIERKTAFLWLHDKRRMRISIQLLRVAGFFSLKIVDFNSICYRLILFWPFDFECVLNDMRSLNAFAFYTVIVISQNNNHIFFFHANHFQFIIYAFMCYISSNETMPYLDGSTNEIDMGIISIGKDSTISPNYLLYNNSNYDIELCNSKI